MVAGGAELGHLPSSQPPDEGQPGDPIRDRERVHRVAIPLNPNALFFGNADVNGSHWRQQEGGYKPHP